MDLSASLRAELDRLITNAFNAHTFTRPRLPDPDDQSLTVEKLYESMLSAYTGRRWRVMRDGIPTNDPETGMPCYYKIEAMPEIGTPEMWCASTAAAEVLIKRMQ
jgi:hypothetical protein